MENWFEYFSIEYEYSYIGMMQIALLMELTYKYL